MKCEDIYISYSLATNEMEHKRKEVIESRIVISGRSSGARSSEQSFPGPICG